MTDHGIKGYRKGCRCGLCRTAKRDGSRMYRRLERIRLTGHSPDEPDALTGGRWVPADGIMRWVRDGAA